MKIIAIGLCALSLLACESETVSTSTPDCDRALDTQWGQGYGTEVESPTNLDSDRCVQIDVAWCCVL